VTAKGPADKAGLQSGDIIISIDGTNVAAAPFMTLQKYSAGDSLSVVVMRNGKQKTLTIKLGSSGS
jgi:S1-C subfamily serine protease